MIRIWEPAGSVVAIAMLTMLTLTACTSETAPNPPADVRSVVDKLSQGDSATVRVSKAAPLADSGQIERRSVVTQSSVNALERVEFEDFDPERILAPVSAEVPEVWIGWYVDRSIDAFRVAIDKNLPLVLVISDSSCKYCRDLAYDSLRCAAVDRFAGEAVFAFSSPTSDRGAFAIAGGLNIEAYPTIAVLEPEARMLLERGRINGNFESSKLGQHLETILWQTAPRAYVDEYGVPETSPGQWTPQPTRIGSELGASLGATNRGLKHAPPTPNCK